MKKISLFMPLLILVSFCSFSQGVGIGTTTPDASGVLDITATNKGLLIPRMNITSINAIINPARGLLVYDSTANQLMSNTGTPAAPNWQPVGSGKDWNLTGNSGINPATQFIGTTDNQPLRFRINNIQAGELHPVTGNIFWGLRAGPGNTTTFSNIAIGTDALKSITNRTNLVAIGDSALFNNNASSSFLAESAFNTAVGSKSLFSNTSGGHNTGIGYRTLFSNISGVSNTATGSRSLISATTGGFNTANGNDALFSNTSGSANTATGTESLFSNITGFDNAAYGSRSLFSNTGGRANTATGHSSLFSNINGRLNTANGVGAMFLNTSGNENTASGYESLFNNTIGTGNTAVGYEAMTGNTGGQFNTVVGTRSLNATSGSSNNTVVGANSGITFNLGFNNTIIGANSIVSQNGLFNCVTLGESSVGTASNQVRFGNTSTTSIGGKVSYSTLSDGRFKKNIRESVKGVEFIMKLRPVMYQLDLEGLNAKLYPDKKSDEFSKKDMAENERAIYSGFVAQEVEQAAQTAGYDFSGVDKPKNEDDMYGLRYSDFVVPMVKAIQEQQQMIQELRKQNSDLQKRVLDLENLKR